LTMTESREIQERYFILPWTQLLDESDNQAAAASARASEHALDISVHSERIQVRKEAGKNLPTGWHKEGLPMAIKGLPYDPGPFIPDEERPELENELLMAISCVLDVATTVTTGITSAVKKNEPHDVLTDLVAAFVRGAEYNSLSVGDLEELVKSDPQAKRKRAKTMAEIRQVLGAGDMRAPATVRGNTQLSIVHGATIDEQQAATMAAIERIERCSECLIRLILLERDEQSRIKHRRI
jgi:hypothetical protein